MLNLLLLGVNPERFLIFSVSNDHDPDRFILRTFYELKQLFREIGSRFPSTQLKLLLDHECWIVNGDGWKLEMKKSLSFVNSLLHKIGPSFDSNLDDFCSCARYEMLRKDRLVRKNKESDARRLQQYFMSEENIKFMVQTAIQYSSADAIYLEPSCGDGRVLQHLAESESVGQVIGCELDSVVWEKAVQVIALVHPKPCSVLLSDFLLTTRSSLGIPPDCRSLIVVSSPPYTLGGGTGALSEQGNSLKDTGRDLPMQFIIHSAVTLQASRIIMLLPPRCAEESFVRRVLDQINASSTTYSSQYSHESALTEQPVSPGAWDVSHVTPPNNEFDFCGRTIRQAAIVQVWDRAGVR
jgi:hypothetical protein